MRSKQFLKCRADPALCHLQLKKMVVGTRGAVIGEIGIAARKELIALLKRNVHLVLPVKVSKHAV